MVRQSRRHADPHRISSTSAMTASPLSARAMAECDPAFGTKHGLPARNDVQRLRREMSEPGWFPRLDRMLQAGGAGLPAVVLGYNALNAPRTTMTLVGALCVILVCSTTEPTLKRVGQGSYWSHANLGQCEGLTAW